MSEPPGRLTYDAWTWLVRVGELTV